MSSKGKAIADSKGKRKIDDDDKTGRRYKKPSGVLQFFEDSAREADDSDDDSLDSLFGDDGDGGKYCVFIYVFMFICVSIALILSFACCFFYEFILLN